MECRRIGIRSDTRRCGLGVGGKQYLHRRTGPQDLLGVNVEVADLSAYDAVFGTGRWDSDTHPTFPARLDRQLALSAAA